MTRIFSALLGTLFSAFFLFSAIAAQAQSADDIVWIQIEAQPSLSEATQAARGYAAQLEDVNGFALGGGWYAIALGPYRRDDAELVLRTYRGEGLIASDSYLQPSERFGNQFWPVGANVLNQAAEAAPLDARPDAVQTVQDPGTPAAPDGPEAPESAETTPAPQPQTPDETVAEARRSERALTGEERRQLQIALKWAGYYEAAIDGAFGRGTRGSMAAWQEANNYVPTGVLTTRQRAALLRQYNAVLDGLGMERVRDNRAGIEIVMPTAEVAFSRVEPPFVHYDSAGDIGARVLLISQEGDQNTLFGLYDIMQTLEIVPLEGPRNRASSSFSLTGRNDRIVSETRARLEGGVIKGYTLIWPTGDEDRRTRVWDEMEASFTRIPGVLDPGAGDDGAQDIDLVAGLQIRKPRLSRSGFFIDGKGTVLTTADVVESCTRITIDGDTEADVITAAADKGVALLQPRSALAPMAIAAFDAASPRLQSEVSVAGYSYEGVLSAATLTFGSIADVEGLNGEADLSRLSLEAQEGDSGGPVFDASGNVIGMLMPLSRDGQILPEDVRFALDTPAIAELASSAGLSLSAATRSGPIAPRDLRIAAQGMTVLVSCWD